MTVVRRPPWRVRLPPVGGAALETITTSNVSKSGSVQLLLLQRLGILAAAKWRPRPVWLHAFVRVVAMDSNEAVDKTPPLRIAIYTDCRRTRAARVQ